MQTGKNDFLTHKTHKRLITKMFFFKCKPKNLSYKSINKRMIQKKGQHFEQELTD